MDEEKEIKEETSIEEMKDDNKETKSEMKYSSEDIDQIIEEAENNSKKKKKVPVNKIIIFILIVLLVVTLGGTCIYLNIITKDDPEIIVVDNILPLPKADEARGVFDIDLNINESTIDQYLFRDDSVYRDMRMLEDPANYESIGGDRFLSGYIEGFEVVPLPYIIPVNDLPDSVGSTYNGTTLFRYEENKYIANYEESLNIIENLFPKDKYIFLMCGGGGYASMTKKFLVSLGWDENKIYNVGGYWYYKGKNNIKTKKEFNGEIMYDFNSLTYHDIDFNTLTPKSDYYYSISRLQGFSFLEETIEIYENKSKYLNFERIPENSLYTDITYTSSDPSVVSITSYGLMIAKKEGTATITITSVEDTNISASCTVRVIKNVNQGIITLDDISSYVEEYNTYDMDKIYRDFENTVYKDHQYSEGYYNITTYGYKIPNEKYFEEAEKYNEQMDNAYKNRFRIFNELLDSKKSFIIIQYTRICDVKEFEIYESAIRVLDSYKIPYIYINFNNYKDVNNGSTLHLNNDINESSIVIVKDGELYNYIDPNVYSFTKDSETEEWLRKYVEFPNNEETTTTTTTISVKNEE